ncbi:hypothetical protein PILCRDRAFT_473685 [Piloderma croceum F 1598]|uniref:Uncharacterized protein n=1 Tax=Piloderma croceum (strain F 1598) TaxID=765440 RepID=A0A0C3FRB3_PILCF|nr:hypothetical protein PILCRDRAFT_473685 [Piloderma croceum F 1598]
MDSKNLLEAFYTVFGTCFSNLNISRTASSRFDVTLDCDETTYSHMKVLIDLYESGL